MKKRILLVSPSELCVGGVPKVIMTLVRELNREYIFDVATLSSKAGYYDGEFTSYGGNIYPIPSIQYLEHKILHPLSFFQIRKAIARILKEKKYEAIHCHGGYLDGACHLAAAEAGLPIRISHGHGTYLWTGRNLSMRFYFWAGKKFIQRYATQRIACSDVAGDTLFLGEGYENVLNPVDVAQYANITKTPHTGIMLLQIGYFCSRKNQIFTIELLKHMLEHDVDVHASFIGYPHEEGYHQQLMQMIDRYGLSGNIAFLPHDFDKRTAFAEADYCLLPSDSEGLPLVALEAQAAHVPCLMSDRISRDSDIGAGFFLPHNDCDAWTKIITGGVQIDQNRLIENLDRISSQAYAGNIKNMYEKKDS